MKIEKQLISVIMSNYNTPEEYLRASIESILNQTYKNFEFIIIDDCSEDNSFSIIESYSDDRIILLKNEKNLGITKSLNKGLAIAKGDFIARMDADDIALATRFEQQVEFLNKNPDCIVCGTGVEFIGEWESVHSNKFACRVISDTELFRIYLLFGNNPNIVHPTAMFNNMLLKKYNITYNEKYPLAQDYRMWVSCSEYAKCANIQQTLLQYRVHSNAVSAEKKEFQKNIALQIMREQLERLNINLTEEYSEIHKDFIFARKDYDLKCKKWIKIILLHNKKYNIYNQKKLEKVLWQKWSEISYFELYKAKGFSKFKVIFNIPIKCYPLLLKLKKERAKKKS